MKFYCLLIAVFLVGCSDSIPSNTTPVNEQIENVVQQQEALYTIVSDEQRGSIIRKVNVELPARINKAQLEQLAYKIKNSDNTSYERTLIMYRIAGEKSVAAWATTHFDPDLEVRLLGLSSDKYKELLNTKIAVEGEIIGKWISPNGFGDHIIVFYKKNNKYFMQNFYVDAILKPDELSKNGNAYRFRDTDEKTYYVVDRNNDLEEHSESGNIYLSKKMN